MAPGQKDTEKTFEKALFFCGKSFNISVNICEQKKFLFPHGICFFCFFAYFVSFSEELGAWLWAKKTLIRHQKRLLKKASLFSGEIFSPVSKYL